MHTATRLAPVTTDTPTQMGPSLLDVLADYVTDSGESLLDVMLAARGETMESAA